MRSCVLAEWLRQRPPQLLNEPIELEAPPAPRCPAFGPGVIQQVLDNLAPEAGIGDEGGVGRRRVGIYLYKPSVVLRVERYQPGRGFTQPCRHAGSPESTRAGQKRSQLMLWQSMSI